MRCLRPMVLLVFALACCVLAGCSTTGDGQQPAGQHQAKVRQLRSKIPLLQADECYKSDPSAVFRGCEKYVTELDSTVGALRNTLAARGPHMRKAVDGLESGLGAYHRLRCGLIHGTPSEKQREQCPRTLVKIHNSLDTMNEELQGTS